MTENLPSFDEWYRGDSKRLFEILSIFLNLAPGYVTREAVGEMADAAMLQAVAGELADSLCEDVVAELARNPAVAGCHVPAAISAVIT